MRRSFWGRFSLAVAVLCSALASSPEADATVMIALSREELFQRSELVVRATVVERRSQWIGNRHHIETFSRLRVSEYVRGTGSQELTLAQAGGVVDGLNETFAGNPELSVGQEYVLFLSRAQDGYVVLTALAQSVFTVASTPQGPVVHRDLSDVTLAARREQGRIEILPPMQEAPEALPRFLADLRLRARGAR